MSKRVLVVDNGSWSSKAGFAEDSAPRVVYRTVVGFPRQLPGAPVHAQNTYAGDEALAKRGMLTLKEPISDSGIVNWEAMEPLWSHAFQALGVAPTEHPVLVTEPLLHSKANRERTAQVLFEKLNVPALFLASRSELLLRTSRKATGVAVSIGESTANVAPIYEGYPLAHAALRFAVCGRELTGYLGKLLAQEGHSLTSSAEQEILRDIKEKLCYVAADFDAEQQKAASGSALEKDYASPNGGVITIGSARFMTAEVLFKPSLIGLEQPGLHELVYDAIMKSDPDIRRELYANIVLGGGTTMFPGIVERLQAELSRLAPPEMEIGVVASPQRKDASWLGGALLLAALSPSAQAERWISRAEYDDVGPSIVERKSL